MLLSAPNFLGFTVCITIERHELHFTYPECVDLENGNLSLTNAVCSYVDVAHSVNQVLETNVERAKHRARFAPYSGAWLKYPSYPGNPLRIV